MAAIALSEPSITAVKKALAKNRADVRSSHLSEALARALGRLTHAALRADLARYRDDPPITLLDDELFGSRLKEMGYRPEPGFSFERLEGARPHTDRRSTRTEHQVQDRTFTRMAEHDGLRHQRRIGPEVVLPAAERQPMAGRKEQKEWSLVRFRHAERSTSQRLR